MFLVKTWQLLETMASQSSSSSAIHGNNDSGSNDSNSNIEDNQ